MRVTEEGLALIRQFEGFRARAYRDAVGVWTIGYGHTSQAGPPRVAAGLQVSHEEALQILARDVDSFARGVKAAVRVPLNDAQFSALVSFAFNVGLGAFRNSSVLRAVNDREFAAVPGRLKLWVKAGGRTLPGLVRRRAAEALMFAAASAPVIPPAPERPLQAPWCAALAWLLRMLRHFHKRKEEGSP